MTVTPPDPKLTGTTASKAQTTEGRLNAFIPGIASDESPVTVYLPIASGGPGNQLAVNGGVTPGGSWTCPAGVEEIQVECYGGGGGGGGGNASSGGGGGGGGEYACEPDYPVIPGQTYSYTVGSAGAYAVSGQSGGTGGNTVFDPQGLGLPGGVVANGGTGGDQLGQGQGGTGGTGSSATVAFSGGNGGTNLSGVNSDNPQQMGITGLLAWWKLDGLSPGKTVPPPVYDTMGKIGGTISVQNGYMLGTPQVSAPPQAPAAVWGGGTPPASSTPVAAGNKTCLWFDYTGSTQVGYVSANTGGIFSGSGSSFSNMTVSCWVLGDGTGVWGGTTASTIVANCDYIDNNTGYALYFTPDGSVNAYLHPPNDSTASHSYIVSYNSGNSALWSSSWHQVVLTYKAGSMILYVDGVQQASTTTGTYTSVVGGHYNTTLGVAPYNNWEWYKGWMSNVWWATSAATASQIAQAYGSVPASGGSGGGASGGSSGNGSNGTNATSSTGANGGGSNGASQPGINSGSSPGGLGGNSGSMGYPAPGVAPFSSGGGGNGKNSLASVQTAVYVSPQSATYAGSDATGGFAGQQVIPAANPAVVTQGGNVSTGGEFQGTQNAVMMLPAGIFNTLGGASIQSITLTLQVEGGGQNGTGTLLIGVASASGSTIPASFDGTGTISLLAVPVDTSQPNVVSIDLSSTNLSAYLTSPGAYMLVLGEGLNPTYSSYTQPTAPAYNVQVVGAGGVASGFSQDPTLTVTYTSSAVNSSGPGLPGYIAITYVTTSGTPVASVQPSSYTDDEGNQFASGFTGPITAFDPTITTPGNYVAEGWKTLGTITPNLTNARFRMLPDGNVQVDIRGNWTPSIPAGNYPYPVTLPVPYRPISQVTIGFTATSNNTVDGRIIISPSGSISFNVYNNLSSGLTISVPPIIYPTS